MHLDHKIPWNLVCSHLKVFLPPPADEQTRFPPCFPELRARNQPRQASDLHHFARVMASVIREFSRTEREKYSTEKPDFCPSDKLFSDAWRDDRMSRHDVLDFCPEMQIFSVWVKAGRDGDHFYCPSPFANVVKALLDPRGLDAHENMSTLLRMARHPEIPFQDLHSCGQNCQHGIAAIPDATLPAYVYLNVIGCLPEAQWEKIQTGRWNLRYVNDILRSSDFDAQQIPHRRFWSDSCRWDAMEQKSASIRNLWYLGHIDCFADMKKLTDYLSMCFEMLVRYDCVMREAGMDIDWVQLIIEGTPLPFDKKIVNWQPLTYQYTDHVDPTDKTVK